MTLLTGCGRSGLPLGGEYGDAEPTDDAADAGDDESGEADAGDQDAGDSVDTVEYRVCEYVGALTRFFIYRIDGESSTCTIVFIEERHPLCESRSLLVSGPWCLSNARVHSDVAACEEPPGSLGDTVDAIAATGTFTIGTGAMVDIDVVLDFPSGGSIPETIHVQANCEAKCAAEDCRL